MNVSIVTATSLSLHPPMLPISLHLHLALSLVTFYRKSFSFPSHGLLFLSSSLASLLFSCAPSSPLLGPLLSLLALHQLTGHLKTLNLQDLINYTVMLLLLVFLTPLPPTPQLWLLPLLLSPLQLIRKPASLALRLRSLRVAFGPPSILLALLAAGCQIQEDWLLLSSSPLLLSLPSLLSATLVLLSALTAGLLFRPDNTCLLRLLLPPARIPPYSRRVEIHAASNALVLLLALLRVGTWFAIGYQGILLR